MIITNEMLDKKSVKVSGFIDTTCLVNFVNTDGKVGVVCYLLDANGGEVGVVKTWKPFSLSQNVRYKPKAKTFRELINSIPPINPENLPNIKGKFYNTFDTPIEVNNEVFATTFEILSREKHTVLERKTYYLITDVQELERTFNSNIYPCEIVNFGAISQLYKNAPVDESLQDIIQKLN